MNVQKATYLNTLDLSERQGKTVKIAACFSSEREYGGVRFSLRKKSKVRVSADYRSLGGTARMRLDGVLVAITVCPYYEAELCLERGEHVLECQCSSQHGAFTVTVEGEGLTKDGPYYERVGGYVLSDEIVVYLRRGEGGLTVCRYTPNDGVSFTVGSGILCDEAIKWTNGAYDTTKRCVCTSSSANAFTVNNGLTTSFACSGLRALATCDGHTLAAGADYLVAYVAGSTLRFVRVTDGGSIASDDVSDPFTWYRRVLSASNGSTFLLEKSDRTWSVMRFGESGTKELTVGTYVTGYDELPIGRLTAAPTATEQEDEALFFCRGEDGKLMRRSFGDQTATVGFADAYHATASSGILQCEGDFAFCTL